MMRARFFAGLVGLGVVGLSGCGSGVVKATAVPVAPAAPRSTTTYVLTVNSAEPSSGVALTVTPSDVSGSGSGTSSFSRTFGAGTVVTVTAPVSALGNNFASWTGCASAAANVCTLTMNANTTLLANYISPAPPTATLTVNSTDPASGVPVAIAPVDNNGAGDGSTFVSRVYNVGTAVAVTAPQTVGISAFTSWAGCSSVTGLSCHVILSSDATVTANYTANAVIGVVVTPGTPSVVIGGTQQFVAGVTGSGVFGTGVTWAVTGPSGWTGDVGTIDAKGLYVTPYPAPAWVTVTATSTFDSTKVGIATVMLTQPAVAAGPALWVDAGHPGAAISPLIYGLNGFGLDQTTVAKANPSMVRWGGDNTSRYNYKTNVTNSAQDYYFENFAGAGHYPLGPTGSFDEMVEAASAAGVEVVGNAPVIGWVSNSDKSASACSFQKAMYPNQQSYHGVCGNGTNLDKTGLTGDDTLALLTSVKAAAPAPPAASAVISPSWVGDWVGDVVAEHGAGNPASGAGTGVAHWDLDNEPEYWNSVHRDVHPLPMTYDELTQGGIGTALAIKTADPTALVSGPVISGWENYFYSTKDLVSGYPTGPCYEFWSNPVDRMAHGGMPLVEYYMQQMKAAEAKYGQRLLDYVDVHAYFAGSYNGASVGLTTAGNTAEQQVRLNSTRVFWDPTYMDAHYTSPNYSTDANHTTGCNAPVAAVQLIPMLEGWVARDYPGTKTSIDEYNFGGLESINGALAEADVLGIFGKYGLDKGMLWPSGSYSTELPGTLAMAMYRNYDGAKSGFGDTVLPSTSADQGRLAVYGARRTSDGALTAIVINKTYGDLTSTLALPGLTAAGPAQVYLYSSANLAAIARGAAVPVAGPAGTGTVSTSFPAQSITLLVIPAK